MNFYFRSFLIFFRIGVFTIGGGYAMVPLIEADLVDKRKWISKEDFLDLMALAQTVPGIFAVNIAIFIGYKLKGSGEPSGWHWVPFFLPFSSSWPLPFSSGNSSMWKQWNVYSRESVRPWWP